jgi:hypothetical protein
MAKPGQLWTYGQALAWIVCALGDFASPTERDDLIARCDPKTAEPERGPFHVFSAARYWPRVAADVTDLFAADTAVLRQPGAKFSVKWDEAASELLDEVSRGQLAVFGRSANSRGPLVQIDRLECATLVFREDDQGSFAMLAGRYEPRWRSLRFDASQIVAGWPDGLPEQSAKPKGNGGRPPSADWSAHEEAYNREVDDVGLPTKDGVPGWRSQSDVIRWLEPRLGDDENPGKTALKERVGGMMRRAEQRLAGN